MDVDAVAPATSTEEWFTIAVSSILCGACTIIYLLCDFEDYQPLFYIFLWLSLSVLIVEYGDKLLTQVFGPSAVVKVKESAESSVCGLYRGLNFLLRLRREQGTTYFWTLNCFFVVLFCISRQMDDASLVYAACMLLSSSPIIRKLLGHSTKELANRASRLFQPPSTEPTELADYMPHINEVSKDFSIRLRRNSGSTIGGGDHDMEISLFDEAALHSLDTSTNNMSFIRESHFIPLMEQSVGSSKATDDDSSPIPSDVEIIDADDIPEDFPSVSSIQTGRLHTGTGDFRSTGTLRRNRKNSDDGMMAEFVG